MSTTSETPQNDCFKLGNNFEIPALNICMQQPWKEIESFPWQR